MDDGLPLDIQPSEWTDDERMGFLMSAFKDRSLNERSWDAKMTFWRNLVHDLCVGRQLLVVDETTLKRRFQRQRTVPACLGPVLDALVRDKQLVALDEILKGGFSGVSWGCWIKDKCIAAPASFAATKVWTALGYASTTGHSQTVQLVHLEALKEGAEQLLSEYCPDHGETASAALPLSDVYKKASNKRDAQLCLIWLCQNNLACVDESDSPALVRFGRGARVLPVDRETQRLQRQHEELERRLQEQEQCVVRCHEEAKAYVAQGNRAQARRCLREKKVAEGRLDKLAESLSNLRLMLAQLRDSQSDAQVLNAYKQASAALKSTLAETGLSEDAVSSTMDDVEEVLDSHNEVKNMMARSVGPASVMVDDSELEDELAQLLLDTDNPSDNQGGQSFTGLPEVPTTPPGAATLPASSLRL